MPDPSALQVIHVVARDSPRARLELARDLRSRTDIAPHQSVLHVGLGKTAIDMRPSVHVGGLLKLGRSSTESLDAALKRHSPTVLHVWSELALAWVVPVVAAMSGYPDLSREQLPSVVLDCDSIRSGKRIAWVREELDESASFVCNSQRFWQHTRAAGAPEESVAVIRDGVDFAAINEARARVNRGALDIPKSARVIAILPPIERAAGSFLAGWAALLVDRMRSDLVVLVPGSGREMERVRRIFAASHRSAMLFLPGDQMSLAEVLAIADLALFLPPRDESTTSLASAMASGVPIVATATPAVTELLSHCANAFLAQPDSPKDAARRIMEALDNGEQCRTHVELARTQAFAAFSRQRMFEQYARLYKNLATDEPAIAGIDDPVFAGV
ncbi:MAG: glycosyltransferase family 4 protein [Phycisphaerae bacterium]